ncbi:MAG: histidine kinase N-terminal 7TM domain-containing protein, partial [Planctomycetota bacterium]
MYAFHASQVRCARLLGWLTLFMSLSTVGFIIELAAIDLTTKLFWDSMQWLPESGAVVVGVMITREYTGNQWRYPALIFVVAAIPAAIVTTLSFTSSYHNLMHVDAQIITSELTLRVLHYEFTWVLYLFAAYLFALYFYAIGHMVLVLRTPQKHHRAQILLMASALAVPVLFSMVTVLEIVPYIPRDLTPFSFALSATLMAVGIFRYKLLNVVPMARNVLVNAMPEPFMVVDRAENVIDYNKASEQFFSQRGENLVGKSATNVLPLWKVIKRHVEESEEGKNKFSFQYSAPDGDFDVSVVQVPNATSPQATLVTAHEISSQKELERDLRGRRASLEKEISVKSARMDDLTKRLHREEDELGDVLKSLQDSENKFKTIFESNAIGFELRPIDGKAVSVNKEMLRIYGMTEEEYFSRTLEELAQIQNNKDLARMLEELEEKGRAHANVGINTPDGKWLDVEVDSKVIQIDDVPHTITAVRDVTERMKASRALKNREALLSKAQKFARLAHWTLKPSTGEVHCSDELFEILGVDERERTFDAMVKVIHPDEREEAVAEVQKAVEERRPFDAIHHIASKSGASRYVHSSGEPSESIDTGELLYFGVTQDVTEKVLSEKAIEHLLETTNATGVDYFRALVTGLSAIYGSRYAMIGKLNDDASVIETVAVTANGQVQDNFNHPVKDSPCEDIIGKSICWFPQGVMREFPKDELLNSMNVDSLLGIPLFDADKKPVGVLVVFGTEPINRDVLSDDILTILASRTSIEIERQRVQSELEAGQHLLANAERIGNTGSWEWNILSGDVRWSKQLYEINNIPKVSDRIDINEAWKNIHPDDMERLQRLTQEAMKMGGESQFRYRIVKPSGEIAWVETTAEYTLDDSG